MTKVRARSPGRMRCTIRRRPLPATDRGGWPNRWLRQRRGALLQEALVAIALLGTAAVAASHVLGILSRTRRDVEHRALARCEVGNLMEEVASFSWEKLPDAARTCSFSPAAKQALPEPQLAIAVTDEPGTTPMRRVAIALTWTTGSGGRSVPAQLIAWRVPLPEETP